jgi:hypothetical protein
MEDENTYAGALESLQRFGHSLPENMILFDCLPPPLRSNAFTLNRYSVLS